MQRIYNLDKWTRLTGENGLHFTNPRPRRVSIEVNAPQSAALSVIDHWGEFHFLALVEGRDTIEFNSLGPFSLVSDADGVMIYTADGADISSVVVAPVIFTKIMERRRRNPEFEAFAHSMQRNLEQTLARQAQIIENSVSQRLAEAAKLAQSPLRSEPAGNNAQPASQGSDGGALQVSGDNSGGSRGGTGQPPARDDPDDAGGGATVHGQPPVPRVE